MIGTEQANRRCSKEKNESNTSVTPVDFVSASRSSICHREVNFRHARPCMPTGMRGTIYAFSNFKKRTISNDLVASCAKASLLSLKSSTSFTQLHFLDSNWKLAHSNAFNFASASVIHSRRASNFSRSHRTLTFSSNRFLR